MPAEPPKALEFSDDGTLRTSLCAMTSIMAAVGLFLCAAALHRGQDALAGTGLGMAGLGIAATWMLWKNFRLRLWLDGEALTLKEPWTRPKVRRWSELSGWTRSRLDGQILLLDRAGKSSLRLMTQWIGLERLIQELDARLPQPAQGPPSWRAHYGGVAGWLLLWSLIAGLLVMCFFMWPMAFVALPLAALVGWRTHYFHLKLELAPGRLSLRRPFTSQSIPWSDILEARRLLSRGSVGEFQARPHLRLAGGGQMRLQEMNQSSWIIGRSVNEWLERERRGARLPTPGPAELESCREQLALSRARPASFLRWSPELPSWMGDRQDHPMAAYFEKAPELWRQGQLAWGWLVQPNPLLRDEAAPDCPAVLVYNELVSNAAPINRARSLLLRRRFPPALQAASATLDPDFLKAAAAERLRAGLTLLTRSSWPQPRLESQWFPILFIPGERWIMTLPHGLWPALLQQRWIRGTRRPG